MFSKKYFIFCTNAQQQLTSSTFFLQMKFLLGEVVAGVGSGYEIKWLVRVIVGSSYCAWALTARWQNMSTMFSRKNGLRRFSLFQAKRIQGHSNLLTISLRWRHSSSSVCDLTSLNFIYVRNEKGLKSINKELIEVLSFVGYKCVLIWALHVMVSFCWSCFIWPIKQGQTHQHNNNKLIHSCQKQINNVTDFN